MGVMMIDICICVSLHSLKWSVFHFHKVGPLLSWNSKDLDLYTQFCGKSIKWFEHTP